MVIYHGTIRRKSTFPKYPDPSKVGVILRTWTPASYKFKTLPTMEGPKSSYRAKQIQVDGGFSNEVKVIRYPYNGSFLILSTPNLYIWASIARYLPPPTPWLWVCIVAPQYPPPPCGVGGGGWWWWKKLYMYVYECISTPFPPRGVGGVGGGGGRSCICMYMNVYDGMNVYF